MKREMEEYCAAGLVTLIGLSIISIIIYNIPIEHWVIIGFIAVVLAVTTLVCYLLGRFAYWCMDKLS
jgi:uncharacterized membrane protein